MDSVGSRNAAVTNANSVVPSGLTSVPVTRSQHFVLGYYQSSLRD